MAEGFSQFFHNTYTLAQFHGDSTLAPTTLRYELTTEIPQADGTATLFTNTSAPGYLPIIFPASADSWIFINDKKITNKQRWKFPAATLDWPSPMGWKIFDNTSGNLLAFGHHENSFAIKAPQRLKHDPGTFNLYINDKNKYVTNVFGRMLLNVFLGVSINPLSSFDLHFGLKDPEKDGDFGEVSDPGYAPLTIQVEQMDVAALGQVKNNVVFDDENEMFIPTGKIDSIKSGAIYVDGVAWLKGVFSNEVSLLPKDSIRIPIESLIIKGVNV